MRSKQKLERKTQSVSEGSLQAVSKQQDFFTNSTVHLPETTKLAAVGPTPTKGKYYKDNKSEVQARDAKRMWVNGVEVKKTHPLYKAGRYKGFEDAAFSSLENYKDNPQGQVYIITNPAWEGWVKVGMAVDAEDRLKNYQTSSPERDYELFDWEAFGDRRVAESMVHDYLRKRFKHKNEWFKCSAEAAMKAVDAIHSELHGSAMMLNDLCDAADDFGDVYLGDGVWLRA